MLNLVLKDILIQKRSFTMVLILSLIMIVSLQSTRGSGAYVVGAMAIVFVLTAGAFAYDERNKGDILINSLPVSRKNVVTARYLSLFVFSVIAIATISVTGMLLKVLGLPIKLNTITLADIIAIYAVLTIIFSIYIPVYFRFGYIKSRLVNMIVYLSIFIFSGFASGIKVIITDNSHKWPVNIILSVLNSIPVFMIGPIFLLLILGIVFTSWAISVKTYGKREF